MLHEAKACGCQKDIGMSKAHQPHYCDHGELFVYTKVLGRSPDLLEDAKRRASRADRRSATLTQGRGFAASSAQQKKVKRLPCTVCGCDGFETKVDPAHVYPRRLASCECAEGVVPLCRECHSRYDDPLQHLDLLPALVNRGYRAELVHAVVAHDVPIRELLEQVTGVKWEPVSEVTA